MSGHPDDELLACYVQGDASPQESTEIRAHLAECTACRRTVSHLFRSLAPMSPELEVAGAPADAASRGDRIGRFLVIDVLGSGAMGTVYAAYDPDLDRRVALKLLPPGSSEEEKDLLQAHILKEAKAMARLVHPNVVAVHDVGTSESRVFIAMEYVDGRNARAWMLERRRSWREVLRVYVQAGRGLAAAHGAGLVHRDFKPDNVLVSASGRVLVTDFGLAMATLNPAGGAGDAVGATNAALGTPAYMAPEQRLGRAEARSDLYALCVSIWEALFDQHPFDLSSAESLRRSSEEGRVREPPPGRAVPSYLRRALLRGLSPRLEDRFSSVDDLLAALSHDRRRRALIVGGVALTVALGGAGATFLVSRAEEDACLDVGARVAATWSSEAQQAGSRAFLNSGRAWAGDAWGLTAGALDHYAGELSAAYRDNCQASVRHLQSDTLFERRAQCLDDRLQDLSLFVDVLGRANGAAVDAAPAAAYSLQRVAECADRDRLLAILPLPRDERQAGRIVEGRRLLSKADSLLKWGYSREAVAPALAAAEVGRRPATHRSRRARSSCCAGHR